jgi:hypothetical protein
MRKLQHFGSIALLVAAAILSVAPAIAADNLALAGTWRLNPEKSHFSEGELPSKLVLTIVADGSDGLRYSSANLVVGKVGGTQFAARFNQKNYPVTGASAYDTVSARRIDAHTFHMLLKKNDAVIVDITYNVAADGQSLRRIGVAHKGPGKENHFDEWFDRE